MHAKRKGTPYEPWNSAFPVTAAVGAAAHMLAEAQMLSRATKRASSLNCDDDPPSKKQALRAADPDVVVGLLFHTLNKSHARKTKAYRTVTVRRMLPGHLRGTDDEKGVVRQFIEDLANLSSEATNLTSILAQAVLVSCMKQKNGFVSKRSKKEYDLECVFADKNDNVFQQFFGACMRMFFEKGPGCRGRSKKLPKGKARGEFAIENKLLHSVLDGVPPALQSALRDRQPPHATANHI